MSKSILEMNSYDHCILDSMGRVEWADNPLLSRVILSPIGKEYLVMKLQVEYWEEITDMVIHSTDLSEEKKAEMLDFSSAKEYSDSMARYYERELLGTHSGDCTASPQGCTKCYAENLLGITTIPDMSSKIGYDLVYSLRSGQTPSLEAQKWIDNHRALREQSDQADPQAEPNFEMKSSVPLNPTIV